jgi:hypothetical protein
MQFNLLIDESVVVPVGALKGITGNPKAKQFFWTGEYFGVKGRSMGEPCVFWVSKSEKHGRWWLNPKISQPVEIQIYSFAGNSTVPRNPEVN